MLLGCCERLMAKRRRDHLPEHGPIFTTETGYEFGVISAADMENASKVAKCAHGLASVQDCQKCWPAAIFHRQILRMCEWMAVQYGTADDWGTDGARRLADEKTLEQCGFLPEIGPAPAEKDIPPLPPIKLSEVGLEARQVPLEGNRGDRVEIRIARPDGLAPNEYQRTVMQIIADGVAQWIP